MARTVGSLLAVAGDPASGRRALWQVAWRSWRIRVVGRALAANPSCPKGLMWCLAHWGTWDVASAVAANPGCPPWLHKYLARSINWAVRASVAANPATSHLVLRTFPHRYPATDMVFMGLATNPSLPADVVDQLITHKSAYIRAAAAAHPAASPSALARMAEGLTEPAWILRAVGANPACPAELSDQLLTWLALGGAVNSDPNFDPVTCTGHPADTRFTAASWYAEQGQDRWAYKHPLWRVRAVTRGVDGRIPIDHVQLFSRDASAAVRGYVTRLSGVPISCMLELAGDADPNVAQVATARVKSSGPAVRKLRARRTTRLISASALFAFLLLGALGQVTHDFGRAGRVQPAGPAQRRCGATVGESSDLEGLPGGGSAVCGTGLGGHSHFLNVTAGNIGLTVTVPDGTATLAGSPVLAPVPLLPGQTAGMTLNARVSSVRVTFASRGASSVVKLTFPAADR